MDLRWPGGAIFIVGTLYLILGACPVATGNTQCYNFTWPGVNKSIECKDKKNDMYDNSQPCIYPLIYTVPFTSPPNISALEAHCQAHDCPVFKCSTKDGSCIQWKWYDINEQLINYSSFCGNLVDQTKVESPVPKTSGCWRQMMGTYMREVCVCDTNYCNQGARHSVALLLLLLLPVAAQTAVTTLMIL
ncbi:hypothetical protein OTU49_007352 [Cherax quadricarinatus]|uniref:Uncharacterized protein n=2 Tax=Cherax quadricarinatus TaxID=27406 RepID=A0AAW0YMA3_CHEQU